MKTKGPKLWEALSKAWMNGPGSLEPGSPWWVACFRRWTWFWSKWNLRPDRLIALEAQVYSKLSEAAIRCTAGWLKQLLNDSAIIDFYWAFGWCWFLFFCLWMIESDHPYCSIPQIHAARWDNPDGWDGLVRSYFSGPKMTADSTQLRAWMNLTLVRH